MALRIEDDRSPQAALIDVLLSRPDAAQDAPDLIGRIDQDGFVRPEHRQVWRSIRRLLDDGQRCSDTAVTDEMRAAGTLPAIGGQIGLIDMWGGRFPARSIREYAGQVLHHQLEVKCQRAIAERNGKTAEEMTQILSGLVATHALAESKSLYDWIEETTRTNWEGRRGEIVSYPWPTAQLTRHTRGIRPGHVVIILGLYKSGKTKLMIHTAVNLAMDHKTPILMLSAEVSGINLLNQAAGCALRIDTSDFGTKDASEYDLERADAWLTRDLYNAGTFHLDYCPGPTPDYIARTIEARARLDGVKVAFLDHLQCINWGGTGSLVDIGNGWNRIIAAARRSQTALVCLSQVPKAVDRRASDDPITMGDAKGSGAFPEAADLVISLTDPQRNKEIPDAVRPLNMLIQGRYVPTKSVQLLVDFAKGIFRDPMPTGPTVQGDWTKDKGEEDPWTGRR